jgi:hypothetical protein
MNRRDLKSFAACIHRGAGDALAGEQIIAQARDIGKVRVVPGTSTHNMQEVVLKSNALCVIDPPFKLKEGAMKLKE